jgi:D-arabinose 1-dehydrogenase-like Zn-dependent alcohol dehydrogenase
MLKKLSLLAASAALVLAVVVPTSAPAKGSKCKPHNVSYTAHGKYVSSNPTLTPGTWSGDLTIDLTSANHHFTQSNNVSIVHKGTLTPATFAGVMNAKVRFSSAVKKQGLRPGDRVTVTGTLTVESGKGCSSPNTVHIHHIFVSSKTGK